MKQILTGSIFSLLMMGAQAQIKMGDNPAAISPGSLLELESTNKALTLPRLTTVQMQSIPSPVNGMIIFNTDSNCIYLYKTNNVWASINVVEGQGAAWPYQTNDQAVGNPGNAKGIVAKTGTGLVASGDYSHAEGLNAVASGTYAWSTGFADTASSLATVAMGYQNKAGDEYGFAAGYKNISMGQSAFSLGQENTDSGWASMSLGLRNKIFNGTSYSSAIGSSNLVKAGFANTAMGESNVINSGRASFAAGFSNTVEGNFGSALGYLNQLSGSSSIAGGEANIVKSGLGNSLFGKSNTADGSYLGAIGTNNRVFYQSAVALGQGNSDSGWASIAGGLNNIVEKDVQYSAVFGQNNIVSRNLSFNAGVPGSATFTAGDANFNSGYASVALGSNIRSINANSFGANFNTIANASYMSAFGHFNDTVLSVKGPSYLQTEMLFAIGNGSNNANRRNSFTMMRNGFTSINTTLTTGPAVPRAELDIRGTGALIVPVGTTAERPATPVVGMIRFCTDCGSAPVLQGYDGTTWVNL